MNSRERKMQWSTFPRIKKAASHNRQNYRRRTFRWKLTDLVRLHLFCRYITSITFRLCLNRIRTKRHRKVFGIHTVFSMVDVDVMFGVSFTTYYIPFLYLQHNHVLSPSSSRNLTGRFHRWISFYDYAVHPKTLLPAGKSGATVFSSADDALFASLQNLHVLCCLNTNLLQMTLRLKCHVKIPVRTPFFLLPLMHFVVSFRPEAAWIVYIQIMNSTESSF